MPVKRRVNIKRNRELTNCQGKLVVLFAFFCYTLRIKNKGVSK